jgi:hypothetical protein
MVHRALRKKSTTLARKRAECPKQGAYVVTLSGTHIPIHRPDLKRKYKKAEYSGDDPHMIEAHTRRDLRANWGRETCKAAKKRNHGKAHCTTANWVLLNADAQEECCIFVPESLPHRVKRVRYNYSMTSAARAMLIHTQGQPDGERVVAHKCGNGHLSCINPAHLYWATPKENARDMVLHDPGTGDIDLTQEQEAGIRAAKGFVNVIAWEFGVPVSQVIALRRKAG